MKNRLDSLLNKELQVLARQQGLRQLRPSLVEGVHITPVTSSGVTKQLINLNSNDYLSLSNASVSEEYPCTPLIGSTSSRLLVGDRPLFHSLEKAIATRLHHPAALLFNSGYHANTGVLPAIAHPKMVVLADRLVHASMIDGIRLSSLPFERFRHNDLKQLQQLLVKYASTASFVIVMVEGLYSMDGDFAPLEELVALKKQYPNVLLYVDEAHSIGVYGKSGMGYAEEKGVLEDIDFLVGTFGKALSGMGAYVACSKIIRNYLINKSRPLIFSTMLPPAIMELNMRNFSRIVNLNEARKHLYHLSKQLRYAVESLGLPMPSTSHIVPVFCGSSTRARALSEHLLADGFYARPICSPTVPKGTERLRLSLCSDMTQKQLDDLIISLNRFFVLCNNK